ncbi:MAG: L-lactate dehydrogenase [Phototrophicaceae bacterium]|jgi:L-lactate dehydrogenase
MKIGIVGTGMVGATAAYALVMRGIGREIVLVDLNKKRTEAEMDDINHAVPFAHPLQVSSGEYSDLVGAKLVIVAAGVGQRPGETRLQLLERNAAVFKEVIPAILAHAPHTVLLIATNPVDIMTHLAARYAAMEGVPSGRVIGSGTTLDTARFRTLLGQYLNIDAYHVHGYVVGEHGDSEVLLWSKVNIGGVPLYDYCQMRQIVLDDAIRQNIDERVRRAAYRIIEGKGATYYGIGSALAAITKVILQDERSILTICSPAAHIAGVENVTVSMPWVFGGNGAIDILPMPIDDNEQEQLHQSAKIVRQAIDSLDHQST